MIIEKTDSNLAEIIQSNLNRLEIAKNNLEVQLSNINLTITNLRVLQTIFQENNAYVNAITNKIKIQSKK